MTERTERADLSGEWSLTFDEAAEWREVALHLPGVPLRRVRPSPPTGGWGAIEGGLPFRVPGVAEEVRPGYHGVTWWSREVPLPGGVEVRLRFGAARLLAEVYWDRRLVAYDLEGATPFEVPIPPDLGGVGVHRLDVRITNPGGSDNWEDLRPIAWAGRFLPSSHDFGGIWQPVTMELGRGVRIANVYVRPTAGLDAALIDVRYVARTDGTLALRLEAPDGRIVAEERHAVKGGEGHLTTSLSVPEAALYGPGSPNRYRLRSLLEAGGSDDREDRFGFRLLDAPDATLRYNGEPFYLRTGISWGWYANGPVPAPDEIAAEVASIAAFGQNAVTAHRAVATPALMDALEERGFLLYQEPGGAPALRAQFGAGRWIDDGRLDFALTLMEARVRRLARRDRNRACLVWWNLANEVFDVDEGEPGAPARRLLAALREEDDSRLTTWTSAWGPTPMLRPFTAEPGRSFDFHMVLNWPSAWHRQVEREVAALVPPAPMLYLSGESANMTGLGGIPELAERYPPDVPPGSSGDAVRRWVDRLGTDLAAIDGAGRLGGVRGFCAATGAVHGYSVARLVEATRANPHTDGLAINGWHSHPNIGTMGLTRLDRRPAVPPEPIRRANAALAVAVLEVEPQLIVGDHQPAARLLLLDDLHVAADRALVTATVARGDEVLWREAWERPVRPGAAPRIRELGELPLPAPAPGLLRAEVSVRVGGHHVVGVVEYLGVAPVNLAGSRVALHDPLGDLEPWMRERGVDVGSWRMDQPGPVLINGSGVRMLHTLFYGQPRRSAVLVRSGGYLRSGLFLQDLEQLGLASERPTELSIKGDWLGGWAFSLDAITLPSLGAPGVWGWAFGPTFPEQAIRGLSGETLAGGCSFPEGTSFGVGLPAVGATAIVLRRRGHELLLTTLPLVERRERSPLAQSLLGDIVRWLGDGP